jgi:CheY-like chemotaxis protein
MPPVRVLVVDDNHLIRRLLGLILEGAGLVPVEAESAEVALDLAGADPPDLCIVDETMPGTNGSELIRELRRARDPRVARVPVIGLSGRPGAEAALREAGASAFVKKPLEEGPLLAAVARALGIPAMELAPAHVPA